MTFADFRPIVKSFYSYTVKFPRPNLTYGQETFVFGSHDEAMLFLREARRRGLEIVGWSSGDVYTAQRALDDVSHFMGNRAEEIIK
jgi:hypothetical protein